MLDYLNRQWFAGYLVCIALCSITLFYIPLHLGLGIPLARLVQPYGIFCLLSLPMTRGIYWAQPLLKQGRSAPICLVMSLYGAAFFVSSVYYGTKLGFFEPEALTRNYSMAVVAGLGLPWLGPFLHRALHSYMDKAT